MEKTVGIARDGRNRDHVEPIKPWIKWTLLSAGALIGLGFLAAVKQGSQIEHGLVAFDVSPSGQEIVFSSAKGDIFQLNFKSKAVLQLTETKEEETSPSYSPDGKSVVFSRLDTDRKGASLWMVPTTGGKATRLTKDGGVADMSPEFSADGRSITFARAFRHRRYSMGGMTWDNYDFMKVDVDGRNLRRLTNESYYQGGSSALTSKGLIFTASGHGEDLISQAYFAPTGKGAVKNLSPVPKEAQRNGAWMSDVELSADGSKMAFISDRKESFHYDVLVAEVDGSKPISLNVTNVSRYNQQPRFMPGGKEVLFLAGTEWNLGSRPIFSLWKVSVGGHAVKVADSALFTDPLSWRK